MFLLEVWGSWDSHLNSLWSKIWYNLIGDGWIPICFLKSSLSLSFEEPERVKRVGFVSKLFYATLALSRWPLILKRSWSILTWVVMLAFGQSIFLKHEVFHWNHIESRKFSPNSNWHICLEHVSLACIFNKTCDFYMHFVLKWMWKLHA